MIPIHRQSRANLLDYSKVYNLWKKTAKVNTYRADTFEDLLEVASQRIGQKTNPLLSSVQDIEMSDIRRDNPRTNF